MAALIVLALGPALAAGPLEATGLGPLAQRQVIPATAFLFNAAVTALVSRQVFGPGRVTAHRVRGAVLLYLNIAALFAIVYGALVALAPTAIVMSGGDALPLGNGLRTAALAHFSLTTLTTTGYGDLVPVHPLARSLANAEAVLGQLFPATLLARIVALHLAHERSGH